MKRSRTATLVVCAVLVAFPSLAQERKLQKSDLPPAVRKTVDEQAQGATIRGFSTERDNGQTIYEAALIVNGHSRDLSMDAKGVVLEIEEQVDLLNLPAAVQEGLKSKASAGKITRVESLTKKGKLVAYEAVVQDGTRRREIQVGPDGKPLAREE